MKAAPGVRCLGMLAKYPGPGQTKTRLAAVVGQDVAAGLSACFTTDLLRRCPSLADCFVVAATPESPESRMWFEKRIATGTQLIFQPEGDLGARIEWFFRTMQVQLTDNMAKPRIVLIGSDSPDLPAELIASAFEMLASTDVVFAPANDGGFVLVGLSCPGDQIFRQTRWSSESALADTRRSAIAAGRSVHLLPLWYDIDSVEDLTILETNLTKSAASGAESSCCPLTEGFLRQSLFREESGFCRLVKDYPVKLQALKFDVEQQSPSVQ